MLLDVQAHKGARICASIKPVLAKLEARRNTGLIGDMDGESVGDPVCVGGKVERGFGFDGDCRIVDAHGHIKRKYGFRSICAVERLSSDLTQRR